MEAASVALVGLHKELVLPNCSAAGSPDEGFEETPTLHRVGVFPFIPSLIDAPVQKLLDGKKDVGLFPMKAA